MIEGLYNFAKEWSKTGSIYMVSDTHFEDSDRSYMNYWMTEDEQISVLKNICHRPDTLIHLGDVGNPEYLDKLKCYKVLITGNHDSANVFRYFDEVYRGPLTISPKIILSHEPIAINTYVDSNMCMINIHGHDHNGRFIDKYHFNIAQNVYGLHPLNLKQFIKDGILNSVEDTHRQTINDASSK